MQKSKNMSNDNKEQCIPEIPLGSAEDVKEWEEARCSICMEHPHNAVLLQCSSYNNGCRPYMCNTSYRHSNCLDQFRKSSMSSPSILTVQGIPSARSNTCIIGQTDVSDSQAEHELTCPLCRGAIYGWFVIDPARKFMNSQLRSCSYENCDFAGNYIELRMHARSDHPTVRPVEVDPERQQNWARLEDENDFLDLHGLFTLLGGGGGGEEEEATEEVELDVTSFADARQVAILESIIGSMFQTQQSATWVMDMELMNDIGQDDDYFSNHPGSIPWHENYRPNNTDNNLNHRQSTSFRGGNLGGRAPRIQNGGHRRMHRNQNNYGQNNIRDSLNSRQNNRFRGILLERIPSHQNGYTGNNHSSNPSSRQNNRVRSNFPESAGRRRMNDYRHNNSVSRSARLYNSRRGRQDGV